MLWTLLVFPGASVLPKTLLLASLALLACIEKLGSIMTTLAVERDWVRFSTISHKQADAALQVVVIAENGANQSTLQSTQGSSPSPFL